MHGGTNDGAPEGNTNNIKHGRHADRDRFYEWLDDSQQDLVDRIEAALIDRYEEYHGREPDLADIIDFYELALGYASRRLARGVMVEDAAKSGNPLQEHVEMEKGGSVVEFDRPHQLLDKISDQRREDRLTRKDKGLEKDPQSQQADAMSDVGREYIEALKRKGDRDGNE